MRDEPGPQPPGSGLHDQPATRKESPRPVGLTDEVVAGVTRAFRSGTETLDDPRERISDLLAAAAPLLLPTEQEAATDTLFAELLGLGVLEGFLSDEAVTDVLVDGPGEVWVERDGHLQPTGTVLGAEDVARVVERLVAPLGLRADRAHPIVDARRADGTRVAVVMPPIAPEGPLVALRRHSQRELELADFAPGATASVLTGALEQRSNIVVYGPTGAGKTSLLSCLCSRLGRDQRLVLVEDTAEVRPRGPVVVRLEARAGTSDAPGAATAMRALVRAALRLRPDRIVVGEVRGGEAAEMVWALNTGHRGSMSTLHADGPAEALTRLEVMVVLGQGESVPLAAARAQVRSAVDVLVGMGRDAEGNRSVRQVHACGPDGIVRIDTDEPAHTGSPPVGAEVL